MMRASVVSDAAAVTRNSSSPVSLMVPAYTASPGALSTGMLSPVTGESIPVDKAPGDAVYAGTINETGELELRVTAAASDTTLARIIHAVEQAQATRAPTQRFVDRFAAVYT